jgi:hypothetical protein
MRIPINPKEGADPMAGSFVLLSRSISNQQRVSGGCGERLTVLSGDKFYQH